MRRTSRGRRSGRRPPAARAPEGCVGSARACARSRARSAWLIAENDAAGASERLEEALLARPEDVALRELHERLASEPSSDRAAWREQRAKSATGASRDLLLIEAAYEHERNGDAAAAPNAAKAADNDGKGSRLAHIALERAELLAGEAVRLADELLGLARNAPTAEERRRSVEPTSLISMPRRATNPASALLVFRSILEERILSTFRVSVTSSMRFSASVATTSSEAHSRW